MRRLHFILLAIFTSLSFADSPKAAEAPAATVHGKLMQREGQTPAVETADKKLVILQGDGSTEHVLHDNRLAGLDLEAKGHFTAPDHFQVDPFHTRPRISTSSLSFSRCRPQGSSWEDRERMSPG